jgi:hypothetical protein
MRMCTCCKWSAAGDECRRRVSERLRFFMLPYSHTNTCSSSTCAHAYKKSTLLLLPTPTRCQPHMIQLRLPWCTMDAQSHVYFDITAKYASFRCLPATRNKIPCKLLGPRSPKDSIPGPSHAESCHDMRLVFSTFEKV